MKRPARVGCRRFLIPVLALMMPIGGCQALYFLTPEKQKSVKAEYGKIGSRKVAVVVWADHATLDVDPRAPRRVCDAVAYDLKKHLTDATFISSREVEDFQKKSGLNWEGMSNGEICERLKCDFVLRIDLLEYTTRASDTPELRRGRVRATVNLYESGPSGEEAVYQTEIVTNYPPDSRHGDVDMNDSDMLREAVVEFGQACAQKFYDHEVSLRGPNAG